MDFYKFTNDMPYEAVIYAKDEKTAFNIYEKEVCELEKRAREIPLSVIDIEGIVHFMLAEGISNSVYLWGTLKKGKARVFVVKKKNGWIHRDL